MNHPLKPGNFIKKIRRNLRDYGIAITLRKVTGGIFGFIYDSKVYRIYMIELERYSPKMRHVSDFTFKLIDPNDTEAIRQIETMEEWLEGKVAEKVGKGGLCLVAMDDGILAGFNLAVYGEVYMPLVNMKRVFRNRHAWSEQITVNKNYRGKGLGTDLRYKMFEELQLRGYKKFYGGTLSNNEANLKLTRKVGFKEIADIEYVRFLRTERRSIRRIK